MTPCHITQLLSSSLVSSLRLLLLGISLCVVPLSLAQPSLIELGPDDSSYLATPSGGTFIAALRLQRAQIRDLAVGGSFRVQLGGGQQISLTVNERTSYLNGDLGISAAGSQQGIAYSLTLTVGPSSLFGHASVGSDVWQIEAVVEGDEYLGWVYQPQGLSGHFDVLQQDYLIPSEAVKESRRLPVTSQMQISPLLSGNLPVPNNGAQAVGIDSVHEDNLVISQVFNPDPVIVGETSTAQIRVQNTGVETHKDLTLELYFLLQDSQLLSADSKCSRQTSLFLQPILYCLLGDVRPGQTVTVNLKVQTSISSQPYLSSSVLVGNLRHDHFVNVVEDVRRDSDADGISDFNERVLGTDPLDAASVDFSITTIDVMSLYTPGAESAYRFGVETRINQLIGVANQVYRDSGVAIRLRPVHHERVDYNDVDDMDTALDHLLESSHPAFNAVAGLRQRYGADLVMLFRPMEPTADRCGLAPIAGFRSNGYLDAVVEAAFAFSHIAIDCPVDMVVAHELGHNMGLSHSHLEDGHGGTFNFSTGFGVDGQFTTVMAYPGAFNTATRVARFSDPLANCLGFPCGEEADSAIGADAVQSLNLVRHQVANYLPTIVPDLPTTRVAALSGATSAQIAIAASRDQGLSFSNRFSPDDLVDITATIAIDPAHVGRDGSIHVMVGEFGAGSLYQVNSEGQLVEWDGELSSLLPVGPTRILPAEERLHLLDRFQFDASLIGRRLAVYVAYRVAEQGDLVYTDAPLSFEIVGTATAN